MHLYAEELYVDMSRDPSDLQNSSKDSTLLLGFCVAFKNDFKKGRGLNIVA